MKLLRGYNQKYLKNWNKNMVYIQHSYNREIHSSTSKSSFDTCFGYFSSTPLDIAYGHQGGVREDLKWYTFRVEICIEMLACRGLTEVQR